MEIEETVQNVKNIKLFKETSVLKHNIFFHNEFGKGLIFTKLTFLFNKKLAFCKCNKSELAFLGG